MKYNAEKVNPPLPGNYNVSSENIRTICAIFQYWDGEKWDLGGWTSRKEETGTMYWYGEDSE